MSKWFANISVNMKLVLGFGLVLALTAVLALTGWTSLGKLIDRSNWMGEIMALNNQLTKVRVTRLQYMVADGDDAVAQTVQVAVNDFKKLQTALLAHFISPENVALLKQLRGVTSDYESSLNKMRNGYRTSIALRAEMGVNAVKAAELIAAINESVAAGWPT